MTDNKKCIIFIARDELKNLSDQNWKNEWNTWEKKFSNQKKEMEVNNKKYNYIEIRTKEGIIIVLKQGELIPNDKKWEDCIPSTIHGQRRCLEEFINSLKNVLKELKTNTNCCEMKIAIHGIGKWANDVKNELQKDNGLSNVIKDVVDYSSTVTEYKQKIEEIWKYRNEKNG